MEASRGAPVYVARGVGKHYGGVQALVDADLVLRAGEVQALVGANGAGKSTLVKILAGAARPSSGTLHLREEPASFANPEQAASAGIALVSQELNLFPQLTALHNLFIMREPLRAGVMVNRAAMRRRARQVVDVIGLDVDLDRKVSGLRLGERQLLEIARALLGEPSILILDEPTSALRAAETERLLEVVKVLRDRGVAVVFVSHFLEDVFEIADRVTVLRGGRVVLADHPAAGLTVQGTIREMLGEEALRRTQALAAERGGGPAPVEDGAEALRFEDVSIGDRVRDVSFTAPVGTVVGLAGLEGSGVEEVMRTVFGEVHPSSGRVTLPGGRGAPRSIAAAVRAGVAFVPADRKAIGLMLSKSIAENVTLVNGGPLKRMGLVLGKRRLAARAEHWRTRLGIKMGAPSDPVDSLSGGNQQKVVFAKWLEASPSVILLDDPTRGVDVGAKVEMQRLMREAAAGRVVLYTSNDLEEMAEVCDRILVFYGGGVRMELERGRSEHQLLEAVNSGRIAPK
jgi:ABC-type sugar transport system ATPase subunit